MNFFFFVKFMITYKNIYFRMHLYQTNLRHVEIDLVKISRYTKYNCTFNFVFSVKLY